jgi:putative spermidine/putrescine transport system ATP-binding protein
MKQLGVRSLEHSTNYPKNLTGAAPNSRIVVLSGVRKTYGTSIAVENLDLEITAGEFFTFLGPSGSGKTTTLRLIAGFEAPDSGRIELSGQDVAALPPYDRDVNTVFQDYALFPHMTLRENVAYGLRATRVPVAEANSRADEALAMVRLEKFGERKPAQLSGGQRQRVALARAIVNRPLVLLLDEPLGALDLKLRHQMQTELKALQKQTGITFLYVTHDQEEALNLSDRIAVFNNGRIEQIGTPVELYEQPSTAFVADFVGVSNVLTQQGTTGVLRPEKIKLLPLDAPVSPGMAQKNVRVAEVSYLGMFTRYVAVAEDGTRLTVVALNEEMRETGLQIGVGAAMRAVWREDSVVKL